MRARPTLQANHLIGNARYANLALAGDRRSLQQTFKLSLQRTSRRTVSSASMLLTTCCRASRRISQHISGLLALAVTNTGVVNYTTWIMAQQ